MSAETPMRKIMALKGFWPVGVVSRRSGYNRRTILKWIESGKIKGEKVGGMNYVEHVSLVRHFGAAQMRMWGLQELTPEALERDPEEA